MNSAIFLRYFKIRYSQVFEYGIPYLIGATIGSAFIGIANRFAMYMYALSYGYRLPLEGVGYMDLTILFSSFCGISISMIGNYLLHAIILLSLIHI